MTFAVLSMLGGYLCIFQAHWPAKKYFGYDFTSGTWAAWPRVLHAWVGYAAVLLSLAQTVTGAAKLDALGRGQRVFTQHGLLGRTAMVLGLVALLLGVYFWSWHPQAKAAIAVLAVLAVASGLLPQSADAKPGETQPFAAS